MTEVRFSQTFCCLSGNHRSSLFFIELLESASMTINQSHLWILGRHTMSGQSDFYATPSLSPDIPEAVRVIQKGTAIDVLIIF